MKIGVLGIGNMGQALIEGFIAKSAHEPEEIFIYDYETSKALQFADRTGCVFCKESADAVKDADVVLLAVKPQVMKSCIDGIRQDITNNTLVISIAAGITLEKLSKFFGISKLGLVRVMPNTPALVGEGASAVCFLNVSDERQDYTINLFSTCGETIRVDESKMDAVTGLSGSGPAFVMMFIEALTDAGVKMGLTRQEASLLAAQTVKGSASMVIKTKIHPAQLKDNVCSPGGTTIAGVHALEKGGFRGAVMDAVYASSSRSKELSRDEG